ncbi:P-loop containing nucleoside triphosphate hydrolase protein [Mycena rosella]|uniref:P-loop containing nucleoside triphosphate hydrolase protein n=1 Tax=Mycena rosella TaxID=1033263 RepID=A0AAD7G9U5_MYCRO|nr:P-loop containing nucleoside triphosphate hydrolase protein [Mycena rosella]
MNAAVYEMAFWSFLTPIPIPPEHALVSLAISNYVYYEKVNAFIVLYGSALTDSLYATTLRLTSMAAREVGQGAATTYISVYVEKVTSGFQTLRELWADVVTIIIACITLWYKAGYVTFAPLVFIITLILVTSMVGSFVGPAQKAWLAAVDVRIKLLTSVLGQLLPIKLGAYEPALAHKINALRKLETQALRRFLNLMALVGTLSMSPSPRTWSCSRMAGATSRRSMPFTIVNILGGPLNSIGQQLPGLFASFASLGRIQGFLLLPERVDSSEDLVEADLVDVSEDGVKISTVQVSLKGCTFGWDDKTQVLCDITLELHMVVGSVASDRSAIARAVYARADLILLDDVFSALDGETEAHVFASLFGPDGILKGKTTVLVTHGAHHLPRADRVVVMDSGSITHFGSFEEVRDAGAKFALASTAVDADAASKSQMTATQSAMEATVVDEEKEEEAAWSSEQASRRGADAFYAKCTGFLQTIGLLTLMTVWSSVSLFATAYLSMLASSSGDHLGLWVAGYGGIVTLHLSCMATTMLFFGFASAENSSIAIDRIQEYANLPAEEKTSTADEIAASDLDDLPPALQNLSFALEGGLKIGICGRTGSGKSSTVLSLFRGIDQHFVTGKIVIDGIDISTVPPKTLRESMSIVTQDPFLWHGSIRENLDIVNERTDAEIWEALKLVEMHDAVSALDDKLDHLVVDEESFSKGRRQLLCLARALLRNKNIIVLDESTSSMDHNTDEKIRHVVDSQMKGFTVIAIAHRIPTIANYDKILVLGSGSIAEFDDPTVLLSNPESRFARLAATQGIYHPKFVPKGAAVKGLSDGTVMVVTEDLVNVETTFQWTPGL